MPYRTEYRGRLFSYVISSTLAQNAVYKIRPAEESTTPNARKWMPFDVVNIVNDSDEKLQIVVNELYSFYVLPKTSKAWTQTAIRCVDVKNTSATTTSANEIIAEFQKEEITTNEVSKALFKSPFMRKLFGIEGEPGR